MQIRPGTTGDHPAVLDVYRMARSEAPSPARLERVAVELDSELLVVADEDDIVVGFALGEVERADRGQGAPVPTGLHVSMVFVSPTRWHEGVGRALLEGLADLGWAAGHRSLSVWSSSPEFYQACGLAPTGESQVLADGRTAQRLTAELEAPARAVLVVGEGIRLGQLLKFAGLVDTGAEAKAVLAAGEVTVNGEPETRRGRQLNDGDEVRTETDAVLVRLSAGA